MKKIKEIARIIKKLIIFLLVFFSVVSIPFLIIAEAWDAIRYVLYFVGFMLSMHIHKTIIRNEKYMWYRWLVNSLIYRWHVFIFKQTFKKLSYNQKTRYHTDRIMQIENNPMWFDQYWFGRGLHNVLTNEIIKAHKENGVVFN